MRFGNLSVGLALAVWQCLLWQATKQNSKVSTSRDYLVWLQNTDIVLEVLEDARVFGIYSKGLNKKNRSWDLKTSLLNLHFSKQHLNLSFSTTCMYNYYTHQKMNKGSKKGASEQWRETGFIELLLYSYLKEMQRCYSDCSAGLKRVFILKL